MIYGTELDLAQAIANRVLDRPNADPDDDIAVLSRQLLRHTGDQMSIIPAMIDPAVLEKAVLAAAIEASGSLANWPKPYADYPSGHQARMRNILRPIIRAALEAAQ